MSFPGAFVGIGGVFVRTGRMLMSLFVIAAAMALRSAPMGFCCVLMVLGGFLM